MALQRCGQRLRQGQGLAADIEEGTALPLTRPSTTRAGSRFMRGDPMKPATKVLAGRL